MGQSPQVSKDDLPSLAMQCNEDGIRLEFAGHVSDLKPDFERFDPTMPAIALRDDHSLNSKTDRDDETESRELEYSLSKALALSGYPMSQVQCHAAHRCVTLTGRVPRYFHVQVAIETTRRLCRQCRIEARITVDSPRAAAIEWDSIDEKVESVSDPLFRVA